MRGFTTVPCGVTVRAKDEDASAVAALKDLVKGEMSPRTKLRLRVGRTTYSSSTAGASGLGKRDGDAVTNDW